MNLCLVAAEVTRRIFLERNPFRLLTSAATVQGGNARNWARRIFFPSDGEKGWDEGRSSRLQMFGEIDN